MERWLRTYEHLNACRGPSWIWYLAPMPTLTLEDPRFPSPLKDSCKQIVCIYIYIYSLGHTYYINNVFKTLDKNSDGKILKSSVYDNFQTSQKTPMSAFQILCGML